VAAEVVYEGGRSKNKSKSTSKDKGKCTSSGRTPDEAVADMIDGINPQKRQLPRSMMMVQARALARARTRRTAPAKTRARALEIVVGPQKFRSPRWLTGSIMMILMISKVPRSGGC
jgi:hypothetical protein